MSVYDYTIVAERLGGFFKTSGEASAITEKTSHHRSEKSFVSSLFAEKSTNGSAALSKIPKAASPTNPDRAFYHLGKGLFLGKIVYISLNIHFYRFIKAY